MSPIKHKISEEQLIELLRSKDPSGIEYLYDHYSSALYGISFRIVNSQELAEEVLQDSFVNIWKKIGSYDAAKSKLFTWMLNIVRNKSIDKVRSAEYRHADKSDTIMSVVSKVDERENYQQQTDTIGLTEVMQTLNEEQRFVLEMVYLKGYTHSELAKEYKMPLGTVKTRLRSALMAMRQKIGNQ